MLTINTNNKALRWKGKCFAISGSEVKFATSYQIHSHKTGKKVQFNFAESTGSEWDPKTIWIYKSTCGDFTLAVTNEDVTQVHVDNYLRAKTQSDNSKYINGIHPNNLGGDGYAMLYMQDGIES